MEQYSSEKKTHSTITGHILETAINGVGKLWKRHDTSACNKFVDTLFGKTGKQGLAAWERARNINSLGVSLSQMGIHSDVCVRK